MILKQGRACLNFKGYFLFNLVDMVVLGWKMISGSEDNIFVVMGGNLYFILLCHSTIILD